MLHNTEAKKPNSAPYVKLFRDGKELTMPDGLELTEESREILYRGKDGQGFIYFIDLDTKKIHLLAADNVEKKVTSDVPKETVQTDEQLEKQKRELQEKKDRKNNEIKDNTARLVVLYDQPERDEKKIQELESKSITLQNEYDEIKYSLQEISTKKITPETLSVTTSGVPVDRYGVPYSDGQYSITRHEKSGETGSINSPGGGDLHATGQSIKGLGSSNVLAGGFWIKRKQDTDPIEFYDFRTRSTANTKLIQFNPLYRLLFNECISSGHELSHTQVYLREIPKIYLDPLFDVFLRESKSNDQVKKSFDTSFNRASPSESAIPQSTRSHLSVESKWMESRTNLLFEALFQYKKKYQGLSETKSMSEIKEFVQSFFDDEFIENRQLLPELFRYIRYNLTDNLSQKMIKCLNQLTPEESRDFVKSFFDKECPENEKLIFYLFEHLKENPSDHLSASIIENLNQLLRDAMLNNKKISSLHSLSLILYALNHQLPGVPQYIFQSQGQLLRDNELRIIEAHISSMSGPRSTETQAFLELIIQQKMIIMDENKKSEMKTANSLTNNFDSAFEKVINLNVLNKKEQYKKSLIQLDKWLLEDPMNRDALIKLKELLEKLLTISLINKESITKLMSHYINRYNEKADNICQAVYCIYIHGNEKNLLKQNIDDSLSIALKNYELALVLNPQDQDALAGKQKVVNLYAMIANSRYHQAMALERTDPNRQELLEKAISNYSAIVPKDIEIFDKLGDAYIHLNQFPKAIKNYLDALSYEIKPQPDSKPPDAKNCLSYQKLIQAYYMQAEFYLQAGLSEQKTNPQKAIEDYKQAMESYTAVSSLDPKYADVKNKMQQLDQALNQPSSNKMFIQRSKKTSNPLLPAKKKQPKSKLEETAHKPERDFKFQPR